MSKEVQCQASCSWAMFDDHWDLEKETNEAPLSEIEKIFFFFGENWEDGTRGFKRQDDLMKYLEFKMSVLDKFDESSWQPNSRYMWELCPITKILVKL